MNLIQAIKTVLLDDTLHPFHRTTLEEIIEYSVQCPVCGESKIRPDMCALLLKTMAVIGYRKRDRQDPNPVMD